MNLGILVPPLIIAAAGIGGLALMAVNLRKARTIEDTPTAKIRSAAQGYLSIGGFARPVGGELLQAPLTGKPCLWYRYTIERYESGNKHSSWDTIESGTSENFFAVDDRTGVCVVDPRHADVTAEIRQRWKGDQRRPSAVSITSSASSTESLSLSIGGFGGRYRYTEFRIHPDEWIYVLGWYETTHAPSLADRTAAQIKQLLGRWKQNREMLLAHFDRNGDGDIDLQEWEGARRKAALIAGEQVLEEQAPAPVNIIGRPPLRDKPYLIASKDPQQLASRYRRHAVLALLFGFGIAAYVLWNFYYR